MDGTSHSAVVLEDQLLDLVEGLPVGGDIRKDIVRGAIARNMVKREQVIIRDNTHLRGVQSCPSYLRQVWCADAVLLSRFEVPGHVVTYQLVVLVKNGQSSDSVKHQDLQCCTISMQVSNPGRGDTPVIQAVQ